MTLQIIMKGDTRQYTLMDIAQGKLFTIVGGCGSDVYQAGSSLEKGAKRTAWCLNTATAEVFDYDAAVTPCKGTLTYEWGG